MDKGKASDEESIAIRSEDERVGAIKSHAHYVPWLSRAGSASKHFVIGNEERRFWVGKVLHRFSKCLAISLLRHIQYHFWYVLLEDIFAEDDFQVATKLESKYSSLADRLFSSSPKEKHVAKAVSTFVSSDTCS